MSDIVSDSKAYGGRDPTVKGFATIDNVSLISIEVSVGCASSCSILPMLASLALKVLVITHARHIVFNARLPFI